MRSCNAARYKRDGELMRIVIFDDEPCIGLQLKKLLEESGNDMTVEYFQEWHTLQFYFSQHAHVDAVFMDICFQGSTQNGIDYAESWQNPTARQSLFTSPGIRRTICSRSF